jgi:hypothetical protein
MRKLFGFILAPALALAMVACAPGSISSAGSKAIVGADASYIAASRAGMALVSVGRLDAEKFRLADDRAYTALLFVRLAAKGGNQGELAQATVTFNQALTGFRALAQ